jgi:endonuclease-3 related protein
VSKFFDIYQALFSHHGEQHWWPGDSAFEIMVGAVLTQNTSWSNVEKALTNLKDADVLSAEAIARASPKRLANWLRPSGYFNVKARRLQSYCQWLLAEGGETELARRDTDTLRQELLSVHGVGPETADDILLYAFGRPVFVIDAYTRRLFSRLGLIEGDERYEVLRQLFETTLTTDTQLFNEYHALIVIHAKEVCRPTAQCDQCCLVSQCPSAGH